MHQPLILLPLLSLVTFNAVAQPQVPALGSAMFVNNQRMNPDGWRGPNNDSILSGYRDAISVNQYSPGPILIANKVRH